MVAPTFPALTDAQFRESREELLGTGTVLLKFETDRCAPCHQLTRVLSSLTSELPDDIRIWTVAADRNEELTTAFSVSSVPTLLILREGELVKRLQGVERKPVLRDAILEHHEQVVA